jgi:hypothetical protein
MAGADRHPGGELTPVLQDATLAEGYPGIALLHAELGDRRTAHAYLAAANRAVDLTDGSHRLYTGRLPGLLLAALAAARRPDDYAGLIGQLTTPVEVAVRRTAAAMSRYGTTFDDSDVLSGLSGAIRLLLAAGLTPSEGLEALVELTQRAEPGWFVTHGAEGSGGGAAHFNLGMAHGVPGLLAALAVACREKAVFSGLPEAVERLASWLLDQQELSAWPEIIGLDGLRTPGGRPGWCYGVPGLARALYLAGDALDVVGWREQAVSALVHTLDQPWDSFGMRDAGLCHGWAGLLHTTQRMAWDSDDPRLAAAVDELAERVTASFDTNAPFGFRYDATGEIQMHPDRPGFLWGAAGVALALNTYATAQPPTTRWDLALLVS